MLNGSEDSPEESGGRAPSVPAPGAVSSNIRSGRVPTAKMVRESAAFNSFFFFVGELLLEAVALLFLRDLFTMLYHPIEVLISDVLGGLADQDTFIGQGLHFSQKMNIII